MTPAKRILLVLAVLAAAALALSLAWWSWLASDPGMLLFGVRLC